MENLENIEKQIEALKDQMKGFDAKVAENKLSMIVFSGDLDKALAAFIIGTGAVAMGMDVVMFFTFWGTPMLRASNKSAGGKDMMSKMFGWMLPKGASKLKLSKMNMGGAGTAMMKSLMQKKNIGSLEQMSMNLMGFKREEMIDYPDLTYCGVAKFLEEAMNSKIQLFL
jgi:peroxiredoxin family protein